MCIWINKEKDTASRSMITFIILNTAAVTIIPTTIISLRILSKSMIIIDYLRTSFATDEILIDTIKSIIPVIIL